MVARMTATGRELFKPRHFDQKAIILCVRCYLSYKPSSLDLVDMLSEPGIELTQTTSVRPMNATGPA
jgi:transposase-like protein